MSAPPEPQLQGVLLTLAYDGSDFAGWCVQPGERTVQSAVEQAIQSMVGDPIVTRVTGRTDAGVHALGQVAAFDSHRKIAPHKWLRGINNLTPRSIQVRHCCLHDAGFNPRYSSAHKTYRYLFDVGVAPNPLFRHMAWWVGRTAPLNVQAMTEAARLMVGTHDFQALRSSRDHRKGTIRTMMRVDVLPHFQGDPDLLAMEVQGTAFMQHMVRIMAGTLYDVGRGHTPAAHVATLLDADASRAAAGQTAPGHGLTLVDIQLKDEPRRLAAID